RALGGDQQVIGVVQVEHLRADEHGLAGDGGEREQAQNGLRLDPHVVVHQQYVHRARRPGGGGLVQPAAEPAGAAEVGLAQVVESVPELLDRVVELLAGLHESSALVGHVQVVDEVRDQRVGGQ